MVFEKDLSSGHKNEEYVAGLFNLIDNPNNRGAPKTWVGEVRALLTQIEEREQLIKEYGEIIDTLARQVEEDKA